MPSINTAFRLRFRGDFIDCEDACNVPREVIAIEFNFQMRQPISDNPFGERFR